VINLKIGVFGKKKIKKMRRKEHYSKPISPRKMEPVKSETIVDRVERRINKLTSCKSMVKPLST